jgi:hypothetical protein
MLCLHKHADDAQWFLLHTELTWVGVDRGMLAKMQCVASQEPWCVTIVQWTYIDVPERTAIHICVNAVKTEERNATHVPTPPSLASQPTAPQVNMADQRKCNLHLRFLVRPTHSLTRAPQKSITLNQIRQTSWCLFNRDLTQSDAINGTRT